MQTEITELDPQNAAAPQTPEQLVKNWQPAVGPEDVAALEVLLDESLTHLGKVLKQLPVSSKDADRARDFLAQFRQPV